MKFSYTMNLLVALPLSIFAQKADLPVSRQTTDTISKKTLEQVVITANKKQFVNKNGNILANVANTPLASVADPVDLLSKLPTVQLSPDGNAISIAGKGQPVIYIDNQRSTFDDVRSLAVADIKSIEIINNPPSRYEADGRAVIRIVRKISGKEGWKTEISHTAAQRRYFLNRTSANVNVRKKRLEFKSNIQYNYLETWEGNAFEFRIPNKDIISKYSVTAVTTRPQSIGSAGMYFQINEDDYLSANTSFRMQNEMFPVITDSHLATPDEEESVSTRSYNYQPIKYHTSNLNYSKRVRKINSGVFIGAQLTSYKLKRSSEIYNSFNLGTERLSEKRAQSASIGASSIRADIETQLSTNTRVEWGANIATAKSNGGAHISDFERNSTNDAAFGYTERNLAAYGTLSGNAGDVSYSAGSRLESVKVNSSFKDNASSSALHKNNTRLFPKATVSLAIDSSSSIRLNYAKTVARPNYTNANQTSVYINPYFEWANNIDLNPAYTDDITATYQYKDYSVAVGLYQTRGVVFSGFNFNDQSMVLRRSDLNYDHERGIQLSIIAPFRHKIWSCSNTLSFIYSKVQDAQAAQLRTRPHLYFHSSNEVRLPKGFVLTVIGWAVSRKYSGALEQSGMFSVDTSVSKTIGKKLSCTARFTDMFASINSSEKFVVNAVAANGIFYDRLQEISFGVKYTFGKLRESTFRNRDVDDNADRIR